MRACGFSRSMVEPGARSETTETPGATTSGFDGPLGHDWLPDQEATVSSATEDVPWVSLPPVVMMKGSRPGEVTRPGPALPEAATTVTPDIHAASTAADSGSAS